MFKFSSIINENIFVCTTKVVWNTVWVLINILTKQPPQWVVQLKSKKCPMVRQKWIPLESRSITLKPFRIINSMPIPAMDTSSFQSMCDLYNRYESHRNVIIIQFMQIECNARLSRLCTINKFDTIFRCYSNISMP